MRGRACRRRAARGAHEHDRRLPRRPRRALRRDAPCGLSEGHRLRALEAGGGAVGARGGRRDGGGARQPRRGLRAGPRGSASIENDFFKPLVRGRLPGVPPGGMGLVLHRWRGSRPPPRGRARQAGRALHPLRPPHDHARAGPHGRADRGPRAGAALAAAGDGAHARLRRRGTVARDTPPAADAARPALLPALERRARTPRRRRPSSAGSRLRSRTACVAPSRTWALPELALRITRAGRGPRGGGVALPELTGRLRLLRRRAPGRPAPDRDRLRAVPATTASREVITVVEIDGRAGRGDGLVPGDRGRGAALGPGQACAAAPRALALAGDPADGPPGPAGHAQAARRRLLHRRAGHGPRLPPPRGGAGAAPAGGAQGPARSACAGSRSTPPPRTRAPERCTRATASRSARSARRRRRSRRWWATSSG